MSSSFKSADGAPLEDTAVTVTVLPRDLGKDLEVTSSRRPRRPRKTEELPTGTAIGDYIVEGTLGAGGCGYVYGARHCKTGKRAAIKVLRAEVANVPTIAPRFIREVEALSRITHENIVEVYDVGQLPSGMPYYVMERLEGSDLRQLLGLHQRLSPREALALLEPVAAALHCAHQQGIVHRDVKASNIFVSESGGKRTVKLLDFGIAKLMYGEYGAEGLTAPGTVIGTPHAMAPEQIRCEPVDCRADIYSLGVLTFMLVTGAYPFHDEDRRKLTLMHLQSPAPRPSEVAAVPAAVDEVVLKCMAKSPADRYGSAPELIEALRRAVSDEPAPAAKGRSTPAVGVRLEIATQDEQELDDEMIEDISDVLDIVESELSQHRFEFPLRASNALTAIRLLEPASRERFSMEEAQALVESIKEMLDEREEAHPHVVISLSARADSVECRKSPEGVEFVGGPLLDLDTWSS